MDTRPWRLEPFAGKIFWFEVDQGPIIELKRKVGVDFHPLRQGLF